MPKTKQHVSSCINCAYRSNHLFVTDGYRCMNEGGPKQRQIVSKGDLCGQYDREYRISPEASETAQHDAVA